jgi:DNA polymerase elongation subunit (family B)
MNLIAKLLMNSLYGKFGMKPEKTEVKTFDNTNSEGLHKLQSYIKLNNKFVQDIIEVGSFTVVVSGGLPMAKYNQSDDIYHGIDVNIAIASAVTSGARVIMSNVKNQDGFDLYYTDTDSIVINKPLPSEMVGSALGQFKLEYEISNAVFLAPKVYGFITKDGKEVLKIKGVGADHVKQTSLGDLKKLLLRGTHLTFKQDKWFKAVFEGNIEVIDVAYQLKATSNKRQPQYLDLVLPNKVSVSVYTHSEPFNYSDIELSKDN